jgi:hypothetical protein
MEGTPYIIGQVYECICDFFKKVFLSILCFWINFFLLILIFFFFKIVTNQLVTLFKEFKDIFAWTYKGLKGIPQKITQHWIKLDTIMPLID